MKQLNKMQETSVDSESQRVPYTVYLKIFFVAIIIVLGVQFIGKQGSSYLSSEGEVASANIATNPAEFGEQIKNSIYKSSLVSSAQATLKATSKEVLSEATGVAESIQKEATGAVVDTIYDNTIGTVIRSLIQSLPEDQRLNIIYSVCAEY